MLELSARVSLKPALDGAAFGSGVGQFSYFEAVHPLCAPQGGFDPSAERSSAPLQGPLACAEDHRSKGAMGVKNDLKEF